jgi:hypothetical protein
MTRYHSKPATVEAWLYDGSRESRHDLLERLAHQGRADVFENHVALMVLTNNGWVEVKPGHYLIQGVADYYPCDPETFEARWSEEARNGS